MNDEVFNEFDRRRAGAVTVDGRPYFPEPWVQSLARHAIIFGLVCGLAFGVSLTLLAVWMISRW